MDNSIYNSLTDAQTAVSNSGYLNWEFDQDDLSDDQVIDRLAIFIRQEDLPLNPETMERFVVEVLNDDPKNYDFN